VGWLLLAPSGDPLLGLVAASAGVAVSVVVWRTALHPHVSAAEDALVVSNPLGTLPIAWTDVVTVVPGYSGLVVSRRSGPPVTIWAVQKSNLYEWLGRPGRADGIAEQIQQLAIARGGGLSHGQSGSEVAVAEQEPSDAVRQPLPGLWRMSRLEAVLVGFFRYSSSPPGALLSALVWAAIAVTGLTLVAIDQWDTYRLSTHGVVAEAHVVDVPGLVEVTWPALQPQTVFLEAGDSFSESARAGDRVEVVYDPEQPTRARLLGVDRGLEVTYVPIALALIGVPMTSGSVKWWRWLTATNHPPTPPHPRTSRQVEDGQCQQGGGARATTPAYIWRPDAAMPRPGSSTGGG
jgi:hypothetical protein